MAYQDVMLDKSENIATLTLNRPEQLNTYTPAMLVELGDAIREIARDNEVRALIVTGAGRAFCAGADLKESQAAKASMTHQATMIRETMHRIPSALRGLRAPVIAAVNGPAMGAGCDLALMADIRIASEAARFGEAFVKVGVTPGSGGAWLMPRVIGLSRACELLFTGDIIDAREAERIGLVSRVVPADQLLAEARALAKRIAANPPLAVSYIKQAIYGGQDTPLESALQFAALATAALTQTKDHEEAVRAFLEKRPPNKYTGS